MLRKLSVGFASLTAALLLTFAPAMSQSGAYPNRPVTILVAFTPGGPSDVLSRIIGKRLNEILHQPFIIENRPGAGGNIAAEQVARATPDGYTLLMGNNSILATNAALYKKLNYDAEKDFIPISLVGTQAQHPGGKSFRAGEYHGGADRAQPGRTPERSTSPPPVTARPRISPASCSGRRPRSTSCMSPTRAPRRRCRT